MGALLQPRLWGPFPSYSLFPFLGSGFRSIFGPLTTVLGFLQVQVEREALPAMHISRSGGDCLIALRFRATAVDEQFSATGEAMRRTNNLRSTVVTLLFLALAFTSAFGQEPRPQQDAAAWHGKSCGACSPTQHWRSFQAAVDFPLYGN